MNPRVGELPGVPPVRADPGGELGVDGRRKGDALGLPNESGDGLNVGALDWLISDLLECCSVDGHVQSQLLTIVASAQ